MFGHEDVSQGSIRFIIWRFLRVLLLSHVALILLHVMSIVLWRVSVRLSVCFLPCLIDFLGVGPVVQLSFCISYAA